MRKDKLIKEKRHDLYPQRRKLAETAQCSTCRVVFEKGCWLWVETAEPTQFITCPACRRIAGQNPAGFIRLSGEFYQEHQEEILNLINNIGEKEKASHPLQRIMSMKDETGGLLVKTTGVHIARRIGDALARAYQGELAYRYADSQKLIRVEWQR